MSEDYAFVYCTEYAIVSFIHIKCLSIKMIDMNEDLNLCRLYFHMHIVVP